MDVFVNILIDLGLNSLIGMFNSLTFGLFSLPMYFIGVGYVWFRLIQWFFNR